MIKFNLLNKGAIEPHYAHPNDSGVDLFIPTNAPEYVLHPGDRLTIPLGLTIDWGDSVGVEFQIRTTSGNASKYGLVVLNSPATIDCGYTGELKVILYNSSKQVLGINPKTKIAQGVFANIIRISSSSGDQERSAKGLGSTDSVGGIVTYG
jgi:dUTP pyrophosphatase